MKILVPVKRVLDAYVTARVKPDNSGVVTDNVKMSLNPFCEIALEQAIRLREQGLATEVIVATIGEQRAEEVLRTALAVGADKAMRINAPNQTEPLVVAKLLKAIAQKEQIQLCLMGKQAIDSDNNQTGQMLAALLGWGQATFVSKLEVQGKVARATREIDGGLQIREMKLPAVITVDLRLNEPRYASLPNIMKARKIPISTIEPQSLGVEVLERLKIIEVVEPPKRETGIEVESAAELVNSLKNKEKII